MYGAVSATLRRLGVRHATLSLSAGAFLTYAARESSVGSSLQPLVRSQRLKVGEVESVSRRRRSPSYAPQGAHFKAASETQSHAAFLGSLLAGQSSRRGTVSPLWGTPTL